MSLSAGYGFNEHEEIWLLLPWLANGRLPQEQHERALQHLKGCCTCSLELDLQRRLCEALALPEPTAAAHGPSLARLMSRIDRAASSTPFTAPRVTAPRAGRRPARLAWAATVLMAGALAGGMITRGMAPAYRARTDAATGATEVLHIAFARDLTIGDMETLLAGAGAQVVEGPAAGGVFGLRTVGAQAGQLQQLAERLRADPRVRWVEPLAASADPAGSPRNR
jgi:hypothetical protein